MRKALTAGLVALAMVAIPAHGFAASNETYRQLDLFGDVFDRVKSDYVEEVPDKELIESAINGMLTSLDPHSRYLSPEDHQEMMIETKGEFGGLGIEVTLENGFIKVVSPIDDTPAYRAGIESGDLITHLDGEQVLGLTLDEAVDRMRGPVNSKIRLTVVRPGVDQPFDVEIVRDIIRIKSVRYRREGDIGYIRITKFMENTDTELNKAMKSLVAEIGPDMEGLVLDLRNNPGGLFEQAVAVSDAFLDQGEIVSTRGRSTESIDRRNARKGDIASGLRMIVLINGGSASASEIVAGALQDHHRALVLGTRSFGKGSVQTVISLGDQGAIRLTTARYYTPSGTSIQATGIAPDIVVEQAKIEQASTGASFREADLRNRLPSQNELDGNGADETPTETPTETPAETTGAAPGEGEEAKQDYQLRRALDLLQGLHLLSMSEEG
jgi:carboxyl-terminal processing protease